MKSTTDEEDASPRGCDGKVVWQFISRVETGNWQMDGWMERKKTVRNSLFANFVIVWLISRFALWIFDYILKLPPPRLSVGLLFHRGGGGEGGEAPSPLLSPSHFISSISSFQMAISHNDNRSELIKWKVVPRLSFIAAGERVNPLNLIRILMKNVKSSLNETLIKVALLFKLFA